MDTVQVVSPGLFPDGDSPELHLSGEAAALNLRNPRIADALFRAGVIEQYGSGIPRIKRACDEAGVAFEYADRPNFTALVFHRPGSQLEDAPTEADGSVRKVGAKCANGLGRTDRAAYDFIADREVVSNADVAEHMDMSANGARKALQRLIDAGLVERDGQGKATRYRVLR